MKLQIRGILMKIATSMAALAVLCAVSNVNTTCMFLTYQPDVPEELQA